MSRDYLNPEEFIDKNRESLPHWKQNEVLQLVTFRLGDSIPKSKILLWQQHSRIYKEANPPPWTPEQHAEYDAKLIFRLERWLDQGAGSCLFKNPDNRQILEKILMHFQGSRVEHHAWVIMPNHVHMVFKPKVPLEDLVQAWKSISAKRIGLGPIWQLNYRDTLIRDPGHFASVVRYIRKNPIKAKLAPETFSHWESDRAKAIQ